MATVNTDQIARFLELTPQRINQLANAGIIPRIALGQFDFTPVVQAYIRYLRGRAGGPDELKDSRAKLTTAKAEIARIHRDRLAGKVIDVEAVEQAWSTVLSVVRTRLLALPAKVAARVKMAATVVEVAQIIRDEIYDILNELATARIAIDPPAADDDDGGDTGEAGALGVGASADLEDLTMG